MSASLRGVILIIIASALVGMTTVLAKLLGTGPNALSPFQITWGRYIFAMMALAMSAAVVRPKLEPFNKALHLARVTIGVSGVTAMFAAVTLIPLADATAISFLNPVIAMFLAALVLREHVGPRRWVMAGIAFIGVLFLVRPGTSAFQPAALIALLAAVLIGFEVTIVKVLSGREPVFQILLVSNSVGTIFASIVAFFIWQQPTPLQWIQLAAIGIIMLSAQALYVPALRSGEASFVVPFTYSTLLFAGLYDLALFGVVPVPLSILGAALILAAGIFLAWREGGG